MDEIKPVFDGDTFAVVEVMGHNTYAGRISEVVIAGHGFVRVDVPEIPERRYISYGHELVEPNIPGFTKLIGVVSIYAITPCSEEIAAKTAAAKRSRPVEVFSPETIRQRAALVAAGADTDDEDYDDEEDPED